MGRGGYAADAIGETPGVCGGRRPVRPYTRRVPEPSPPPGPVTRPAPPSSALPSRTGVGFAAAVCLIGAAVWYGVRPDQRLWWGGGVRVGLVLTALWFALPGRDRPAAWAGWDWKALGFVGLCGLLSFRAPQLGVPLLAAWWFWRWLKTPPRPASAG